MISIRHLARRGRDERGQSLVEFALILPFLLILLMGIFEIGRAWQKYQVITDAAREGARVAAIGSGDASVDSAAVYQVVDDALARGKLTPADATVYYENLLLGTGRPVTVSIEYPHNIFLLGSLMHRFRGNDPSAVPGPDLTLKTSVTFRNE